MHSSKENSQIDASASWLTGIVSLVEPPPVKGDGSRLDHPAHRKATHLTLRTGLVGDGLNLLKFMSILATIHVNRHAYILAHNSVDGCMPR